MADHSLEELAVRVEGAPPEMQGKLLEEAWDLCAEHSAQFRRFATTYLSGFDNNAGRFSMCLEASAYESAAMMLVPEGRYWVRQDMWPNDLGRATASVCKLSTDTEGSVTRVGQASLPALALCAAALRARAVEGESCG